MGFYGNISSNNRSSFSFDRTFTNRYMMDMAAASGSDNVYVGRYVLVDYDRSSNMTQAILDSDINVTKIHPAYIVTQGTAKTFHTGPSFTTERFVIAEDATDVKTNEVIVGGLIMVMGNVTLRGTRVTYSSNLSSERITAIKARETYSPLTLQLWKCTGEVDGYATFELMTEDNGDLDGNGDTYSANYQIDNSYYGSIGRGWDSTVWRKVISTDDEGNSIGKYVMVAELNSVVPTFDISVDAPTQTPITPHFDSESTGVYYRLHLQPGFGMRIKGAKNRMYTTDDTVYPSDVNGDFVIGSYLKADGYGQDNLYLKEVQDDDGNPVLDDDGNTLYEWATIEYDPEVADSELENVPLAIYFNKKGFDPHKGSSAIADAQLQGANIGTIAYNAGTRTNPDYILADAIKLRPTGTSTSKYNVHDNGSYYEKDNLPDTAELSVMLPSIGESMSDMWDVVYGTSKLKNQNGRTLYNEDTYEFATNEANSKLRNMDISWNSPNGDRTYYQNLQGTYTYDANAAQTLAGTINTGHDAIGMVIRKVDTLSDAANWDPTKIYYYNNKFYRKHKNYTYTTSTSTNKYQAVTNMVTLNNLYRRTDEQMPVIADNTLASELLYHNYVKAQNEQYIDGAIYGTLTEPTTALELNDTAYEPNLYYYYDSASKGYVLDESDTMSSETGLYYEVEPTRLENGIEFYQPNTYWYKNTETGAIGIASAGSLLEVCGSTESKGTIYKFYRYTGEPEFKEGYEIDEIIDLTSAEEFPPNSEEYTYTISVANGLVVTDNEGTVLMTSEVLSIDSDSNTYTTYLYEVEGYENGYTKWDIYTNGYTIKLNDDGTEKKKTGYTLKSTQGQYIVDLDDESKSYEINLISFVDNKYYFNNGNGYYLEDSQSFLTTEYAANRNNTSLHGFVSQYFTLEITPMPAFYNTGGDFYYKLTNGDWKHETVTKSLNTDGVVYYSEPTLTAIDSDRIYRPNYFYTLVNGNYVLATGDYSSTTTYYVKKNMFVASDYGTYKKGEEIYSDTIPTGVTAASRSESWEAVEIQLVGTDTVLGSIVAAQSKIDNLQEIVSSANTLLKYVQNGGTYSYINQAGTTTTQSLQDIITDLAARISVLEE